MTNLMIFYPVFQLTVNELVLSSIPAKQFFPHITIPSVVQVIKTFDNVAEVQFPATDSTDIVSVDFLHCVDSPEVGKLTKMIKEQQGETSNKGRKDV